MRIRKDQDDMQDAEITLIATVSDALAHPARIRMFRYIMQANRAMVTVCNKDLVEHFDYAQATVSQHMKKLVEQLLFLARGESGRQKMQMENLSLTELLTEVCEESKMIDPDHTYRLVIEAPMTAWADVALLKQAVRILADNAAKYTPPKGSV